MLRLLHISDLHFGPYYQEAVGTALLAAAGHLAPDIIVASGDFTQRAKRIQFADARRFLDSLPRVPLVVVPGNHDIPLYRVRERLLTPFALYREFISPELNSVLRRAEVVIIGLNSTAPLRKITEGIIAARQLDFCRRAFADAGPSATRIVVAHHHFAPPPDYDHDGHALVGARAALDCFNELGIDLILGGHLHRAYIGNSLDVYPGDNRTSGIIIVQSGTSTSRRGRAREREKNTFNMIEVDDDVVRITHHMYFHELPGFAPLSRHEFARRSRPYLGGPSAAD